MTLNCIIKKPVDTVFDCLSNMSKFVSVHPVINKINYLEEGKYMIFERLKCGFFFFSFSYPATIESNYAAKKITMKAVVMKLAVIEMCFSIKEMKNYSLVTEEIKFETVLPIQAILKKIFRKQHVRLFKNIENIIDLKR